jgi:hypothetical protein
MSIKDLKKAYIEPVEGGGEKLEVLFNPNEYSIEKSNQFNSKAVPGLPTPISQYVHGNADTLTMELFFDTYTYKNSEDVTIYTKKLSSLLDVNPKLHAPPVVRFIWGEVQFKGIIERLTQKFTMFLSDGTPVRASLNVTFKEYKTIKEQLSELGRESADRTHTRIVREGESLWIYAAQEYDDPGLWRNIARKNRIFNPRILKSGERIEIPPVDTELE